MSIDPEPVAAEAAEEREPTSRWEASPPVWLRLVAGVGSPALVGLLWYACWTWVDTWPSSPSGDTGFAWMPLALALAVIAAFLGLGAIIPRTLGAAVAAAVAVWLLAALPLFLMVPSYGASEGFPSSALPLMLGAMVLSALPVAALALWPMRWSYVALGLAVVAALGAGLVMQRVASHQAELEATGYVCAPADAQLVDDVVRVLPGAYLDGLPPPEMQTGDLCESLLPVRGDADAVVAAVRASLEDQGYAVSAHTIDYLGSPRTIVVATADGRRTVSLWIDVMGPGETSVVVAVGDQRLPDR